MPDGTRLDMFHSKEDHPSDGKPCSDHRTESNRPSLAHHEFWLMTKTDWSGTAKPVKK